MGKKVHFGKPSRYPYYFVAVSNDGNPFFKSGVFHTKKAAKEAAVSYINLGSHRSMGVTYRVRDRRK